MSDHIIEQLLPNRLLLCAKEVAPAYGVKERTIRRWAEQFRDSGGLEGIPAFKSGKLWRFARPAVREHLLRQRTVH